jgi:hypothetical protein
MEADQNQEKGRGSRTGDEEKHRFRMRIHLISLIPAANHWNGYERAASLAARPAKWDLLNFV